MDYFIDDRDYQLLRSDPYTFFVLRRIIDGDCTLLLSDHERMIFCFTQHPFPVWIWTPDDASEEEMKRAYDLAKENDLLTNKHTFNLKYELADYFLRRAKEEDLGMAITRNMFAYDCPEPIAPPKEAEGEIHCCDPSDIEELVTLMDSFHIEIGLDQKTPEEYRKDAEESIASGKMFFWNDPQGHHVATCKYAPTEDMASVNLVYTRPEYRRKHFAENLVYQVTKKVIGEGYLPMLYTDADYVASNACYEKIGYQLKGKLCTIQITG